MRKLDCERVQHLLSDHLERTLTARVSAQVEEHFAHCASCLAIFAGIRYLVGLARDSRAFSPPEGFSVRLRARLETLHRAPEAGGRHRLQV